VSVTSAATPSTMIASAPFSGHTTQRGLPARLRPFTDARSVLKQKNPSIQHPQTGATCGRPSGLTVDRK